MNIKYAHIFSPHDRVTFTLSSGRVVVGTVLRVSKDENEVWPVQIVADDDTTWSCMASKVRHLGQQLYSV